MAHGHTAKVTEVFGEMPRNGPILTDDAFMIDSGDHGKLRRLNGRSHQSYLRSEMLSEEASDILCDGGNFVDIIAF